MSLVNIGLKKRHNIYRFWAWAPMTILTKDNLFGEYNDIGVLPVSKYRELVAEFTKGKIDKTRKEFMNIIAGLQPNGLKWQASTPNLITDEGETLLLDRSFNGGTFTDYVGLTDGTPTTAEADTMASHAGWTEVTAYDEAARQDYVPGSAASQSIDNSASPATFTIDTNSTTIGGAFLSTDSTRGGTTGTLIGVAAFSAGDKTIDDNDTLDVTITSTAGGA